MILQVHKLVNASLKTIESNLEAVEALVFRRLFNDLPDFHSKLIKFNLITTKYRVQRAYKR